ncbi:MAG TPA: hypothetical protein VD886_02290, partial [Herpetosiphonaceae bacterium]|nr:hypothetical protein [Herpetosiphonaceae bacterium]
DFRWGLAECLEGLAALAAAGPDGAARAAALLGAAAALRAEMFQARAPHEQDLYAATLDRLSRDLDPAALEAARQRGAALPLEAVIGIAMEG